LALCSMTRSLTAFVYPDATTSWPRSRSEKVRSSAISGVSSMSRTRAKLFLARRARAREPFLFTFRRFQIHHPDSPARSVVSSVVIFDHGAPRFQRPHGEGDAFEIAAGVVQHFIGVPVGGENGIAWMHAQHGVVAVVGRFRTHVARGAALFTFTYNVTFLALGFDLGLLLSCESVGLRVHTVSATAAASVAAAMFTRFFASAA